MNSAEEVHRLAMRHGPATEDFSAVYEYLATNRYSTERGKLLGDFGRSKSTKSPRMTNIHPMIAPGAPGVEPRWTRSTKEGLGTAYHTSCTLWFTLSHGIARDGEVFGKIHPAHERYAEQRAVSRHEMWTFRHQTRRIPRGKTLRLLVAAEATVRWTFDAWQTVHNLDTDTIGLPDLHSIDLPTHDLPAGIAVERTFHWRAADHWEGRNFRAEIHES